MWVGVQGYMLLEFRESGNPVCPPVLLQDQQQLEGTSIHSYTVVHPGVMQVQVFTLSTSYSVTEV